MLNLPWYRNRGHRCAETVLKAVIKYYHPVMVYHWDELAAFLRNDGKLVHPIQIAKALMDVDVPFRYLSHKGIEWLLEGNLSKVRSEMKDFYGEDSGFIIKNTNLEVLVECARTVKNYAGYKKEPLSFEQVEKELAHGYMAICLLSADVLLRRENRHRGHYVIATGIDTRDVICYDCGPFDASPTKKIVRKTFLEAWNKLSFLDEGTLLVGS